MERSHNVSHIFRWHLQPDFRAHPTKDNIVRLRHSPLAALLLNSQLQLCRCCNLIAWHRPS
jgi:hypothetical protein